MSRRRKNPGPPRRRGEPGKKGRISIKNFLNNFSIAVFFLNIQEKALFYAVCRQLFRQRSIAKKYEISERIWNG